METNEAIGITLRGNKLMLHDSYALFNYMKNKNASTHTHACSGFQRKLARLH